MRSAARISIVVLLLLTFGGIPTYARIRHVPNDYMTIQAAIDAAHNGDTVLVQPETYVENLTIIGKDIVVASLFLTTNDDNFITRTIIDGDDVGSVVNFRSEVGPDCKLIGFTLRNGLTNYGGGIYLNSSSPILEHLVIWDNYARRYGGGVYATHNSNPTMINVTISGNRADLGNGAFHRYDGSDATILNSILYDNTPFGMPDELTVTYSDIEHGYGGEGNIDDDPDWVDPDNGDFSLSEDSPCIDTGDPDSPVDRDGSRADMGAIIFNQGNVHVFMVPDEFATIQAAIDSCADGDTVLVQPGVYVENIDFLGKEITVGSMFLITDDRDYIHQTIIDGDADGSVVTLDDGETENSILTGFTIRNGDARNGGGITISRSNPTISSVEVEANSAERGGGIYLLESDAILRNVAAVRNSSDEDGSGISCYNANPQLVNCTISRNITDNGGGGFYCDADASPNLNSCIVWDNDAAEIVEDGAVTVIYSDIEGGWEGEGNIDADPLFADPDGGDFQLTWANWREEDETKSPCIDAGDPHLPPDPEATRADMGAYYWHQEPYRAIISVDPQSLDAQINSGDVDTLNFTMSNEGDTLLIFSTEVEITLEPEFAPRRDRRGGPDEIEYEWRDNDEEDGPDYNWIDIGNREGVIDVDFGNDTNEGPFDLGFEFNHYGIGFNSVRMCSNGWASFTSSRTYYRYSNWDELPSDRAPENFLGVAMSDWNPAAGGGEYHFWSDETMAVMSWENIPHISGQGRWTFQIVLTPDGMIKYQYAETGAPDGVQLVGLQNEDRNYGFEILRDEEDYLTAGRAIGISRVWPEWIRVEPIGDEVAAEGNLEMDVIIDAEDLFDGDYGADVHILSNDPENPDVVVPVSVEVIGIPSIELAWNDQLGYPDIVDWNRAYENVIVGYDYDITLDVINDGTAILEIDSIDFDNGAFSVEDDSIRVPPMQTGELTVTFHTDERGRHDATMTVHSNDPDHQEYEVALTATSVILAPAIEVEWSGDAGYPDVVNWNLVYDEVYATASYDVPITVRNAGDRDLEVVDISSGRECFTADADGFVLQPDEEREVTLTFEADTSGEYISVVTIHNNTDEHPHYPVAVHAEAMSPPVIALEPESITDSLYVGWTANRVVNVSNEGEATLNFTIDQRIINEPERDPRLRGDDIPFGDDISFGNDERALRGVNGPRRDDAGDLIDSFNDPVGGGVNFKGLIWDEDNGWMWISHWASPFQMWPVDPADDYNRVDGEGFNAQGGCMTGCMVDGVIYVITVQGGWYAMRYSRDGENLGRVNTNFQVGAVAYSREMDLLFAMNAQSNLDIHVFELDEDGDIGDQVGVINDYRGLINNWWSRSMCWVDRHRNGQLWLNTQRNGTANQGNTVHEILIDTDEWSAVERVQNFDTWDAGGGQMYDGVAHDGQNLWASQYASTEVRIFDDGVSEHGWLSCDPAEGSIPGGENLDIDVTLDARGETEGFYEADMIFHSNDPHDPDMALNVRLFISEPPSLVVEWDRDYGFPDIVNWNMAYPDLYNGLDYDIELTFTNYAEQPTHVDSIRFLGGGGEFFSVDQNEFSIEHDEEVPVTVTLRADASGAHHPTMMIYSDARRFEEYPVPLMAETADPPSIEVDPDIIEDALITGETDYHNLSIFNRGEALLRFTIDPVSISEPERDAGTRMLRSVRGPARPHRDDPGDVVDRFAYNRIGPNSYKSGIAWDWENKWMWLTSYSVRGIGAVDPNDNYREKAWTALNYGPMGAGWNNGILYVVPWPQQQLRMYDEDLNMLGNINLQSRPTAVDCADDFIIYITDIGGRNIEIIDYNGERIATISQNDWMNFVNYQTSRSLCWVDEHPDGQLWINTARHIWQLAVDTDEWEVTGRVADFNFQQGATEWDGIGHDGHNLWLGSQSQAEYYIVEDGVTERFWLSVDIDEGVVEGDSGIDVTVTLNARWLQGGDYEGALIIDSNDPNDPSIEVSVLMNVDAAPDIEVTWRENYGYPDLIDWNRAYEGIYPDLQYEITVEVNSSGVTDLEVDSIRIDDDAFTADADAFDLDPNESRDVTLTFEADETGEHDATITFYSNSEAHPELEIPLHALAINAPVINVDPMEIVQNIRTGEISERTITVENQGGATLRFEAEVDITREPGRDDDVRTMRRTDERGEAQRDDAGDILYRVHTPIGANQYKNLGYDADNNWMWHNQYTNPRRTIAFDLDHDNEIVADWNMNVNNPMDIAVHDGIIYIMSLWGAYLSRCDLEGNNLGNLNLNLGGANVNGVAVDTDDRLLIVGVSNNNDIYAFDLEGNRVGSLSGVRARVGNRNWRTIEWVSKHSNGQLWVHTAGRVWQFAVDTDNWEFIGDDAVQDFEVQSSIEWDGMAHDRHDIWVSNYWNADLNVYDDGINELYWLILDPTEGEIPGGEDNRMELTLSFIGTGLVVGEYLAEIHFTSNDPFNPEVVLDVTMNVAPAPDIEITWEFADENEPDLVDWNRYHPELYYGNEYRVPIIIHNAGGATLRIDDISSDSDEFSAEPVHFEVDPYDERGIEFIFNAPQPGEFESGMTIVSNDPDEEEIMLRLHAQASAAPQIEVDPVSIVDSVQADTENDYIINIANTGLADLRFWSGFEVVDQPQRDRGARLARHINQQSIPGRDDLGEEIDRFTWQRSGADRHKAGIAWDPDNDWMWLTSYNNDYLGAVDPADNFEEVTAWQLEGQHPMGAAWLDGVIYIVNWARQWLGRWDAEGHNLGQLDTRIRPTALTSSGEYLLVMSDAEERDISVITPEGDEIGTIDDYRQYIEGNSRSIQWVELHPDGQLWINTPGHIWQIEVNPDWQAVRLVQDFEWSGEEEWDGIGHDGYNLYLGGWNNEHYYIVDDGIEELRWIYLVPARGSIEPDADLDATLTLDMNNVDLGDYEANLIVHSNDPESPEVLVNVQFNVADVDIAVEPLLLDFGEVDYLTSDTLEVTLRNEGWFELNVSDVTVQSEYFAVDFSGPIVLERNEESSVEVMFLPDEEADYEATLVVASDDPDEPTVDVRLVGRGVYVAHPPEVVSQIEDIETDEDFEPFVVADLDTVFFDPNGEELVYSAYADEEGFTAEIIDGNLLRIDSDHDWNGETEVTVIADDQTGGRDRDLLEERGLRSISSHYSISRHSDQREESRNHPLPRRDLTAELTFTVSVLPVNDPPVVAVEIPDQDLDEDTGPWIIADLDTVFSDVDLDELDYEVLSADSLFSHLDEENVLTLDAPQNFFDTDLPVLVIASDGEEQIEDGFLVTIHNVNDPPVVLQPIPDVEFAEDTGPWNIADLDEVFFDVDNDVLTFEADPDEPLTTQIVDDHLLTLEAPADYHGSDLAVTVTASDGEGQRVAMVRFRPEIRDGGVARVLRSLSQAATPPRPPLRRDASVDDEFNVTIAPVNDPPVWDDVPEAVEGSENSTVQFTVGGSDVDGDDLTIEYSSDDLPEAVEFVDNGDGTAGFSWETGFEDAGRYNATFTLSDDEFSVDTTVAVTILNVNRPPVWTQMPESFEIDETDLLEFNVSGEDPDGQDIEIVFSSDDLPEAVEYEFDGENSGAFSWQTTYEDSGSYTAAFTMSDGESEVSADVEIRVLNVNRPPSLTDIGDLEINEDEEFVLQLEASDPDGDNLAFEAENLPDGATLEGDLFSWTPTYDQAGVYEGIVFRVRDDGEPNLSDEETIAITVLNVNRPPLLAGIGDLEIDENEEFSLQLEASDPDGDSLSFEADNLPEGATLVDGLFSWTPTYEQAGVYEGVVFRVRDNSEPPLSDQETITITVSNVNRPPVFVEMDDIEISENEEVSLQLEANDPDGDDVFFEGENLPAGASVEDDMFIWTPGYDQAGVYEQVIFWAYDNGDPILSDRESITITVLNVNRPPLLAEIGDLEIRENEPFTLHIQADDPDGDSLTFEAENLPDGATFEGNLFSWTPSYDQAGVYEGVRFSVHDDGDPVLNDEETITITVLNVNRPPALSDIGDIEIDEDEELVIQLTAFDPDDNSLRFEAENLPEGATLEDDLFSWTPGYDQAGVYEGVVFRVWDDGEPNLSDEETITITVLNVNRPPVLSEIGDLEIDEAEQFSLQLEANDPDDDGLLFEADNLPDGASLEDDLFSWTPTYDQAGVYEGIVFRVWDDGEPNLSDEETITITVFNVNRPPVWTNVPEEIEINETDLLELQVGGEDQDGDDVTIDYRSDDIPEAAQFTDNGDGTAALDWQTTYEDEGEYTAIFTLSDGEFDVEAQVSISVGGLNRPPEVTHPIADVVIEEDPDPRRVEIADLDTVFNDPDGDGLSFDFSGDTEELNMGIDEDNVLHISPQEDYNLPDGVEITVTADDEPQGFRAVGHRTTPAPGAVDDDAGPVRHLRSLSEIPTVHTLRAGMSPNPRRDETTEDAFTLTVSPVNDPPAWDEIPDPVEVVENDVVEFDVSGSDIDSEDLSVALSSDDLPEAAEFEDLGDGSGRFTWQTTYEDAGYYTALFTISDGEYEIDAEVGITVLNANRSPVWVDVPDIVQTDESELVQFNVIGADPDSDDVRMDYSSDDLPDAAGFEFDGENTGTFSWQTTYDDSGTYTANFTLTDGEFEVEADVRIIVQNVNCAPEWSDIPEHVEADETETVQFSVTGSDPDGDDVSIDCESDDLPQDAHFTDNGDGSGDFIWETTFDDSGTFTALFTISDGDLATEATVSITIANVNRAPFWVGLEDTVEINEGDRLNLMVSAEDPDEDEIRLEFSSNDMPEEAEFTDNGDGTGALTWQTGYRDAGEYIATLTVTDGALDDEADVVVIVSDVNQPPEIIGEIEDLTIGEDPDPRRVDIIDLDDVFSDPDGDDLFFSFSGAPDELNMEIDGDNLLFFSPDDDFNLPEGELITVTADDQRGEGPVFLADGAPIPDGQPDRDIGPVRGLRDINNPFGDAYLPGRDLSIETSFILTVESTPDPPAWVYIPEQINATVIERIHFTIEASDADDDALEYEAEIPEGAEFTDNGDGTGVFDWQTTIDDEGDYSAGFSVTDGDFTLEAEVPIHIAGLRELDVPLESGWNLLSVNVRPLDDFYAEGEDRGPDVWLMIEQMRIDENNHRVFIMKDERGDFCSPGWNFNSINFWNLTEGYLVKMTEEFDAVWTGLPIPPDADVPIEEGWNMIVYFPDYDLPADAESDYYVLSPIIEHVIIAKNGTGQFMAPQWGYSDMDPWTPGQGYQINVDEDVVLNYPDPPDWQRTSEEREDILGGIWTAPQPTGSNMSILVTGIDGYQLSNGDQIAAFSSSGELVGVGSINDRQSCGLAVWGDDVTTELTDGLVEGETFELKLWDSESREIYNLDIAAVYQGKGLTYRKDGFAVVEMIAGNSIPDDFHLYEAHPNPFNAVTTIGYSLPAAGHVRLAVYDISGRTVGLLVDDNLAAGRYVCEFDGIDLSAGLYFVRLEAGSDVLTRKVVFIK